MPESQTAPSKPLSDQGSRNILVFLVLNEVLENENDINNNYFYKTSFSSGETIGYFRHP